MNNSETPTGAIGKEENYKETKISFVNEDFNKEWDFEICGFGFDMDIDKVKKINDYKDVSGVEFFHDQKSDEHFGLHTSEKQAEIINATNQQLNVSPDEKVLKQNDREEIQNALVAKEGKAELGKVKEKVEQLKRNRLEKQQRKSADKQHEER